MTSGRAAERASVRSLTVVSQAPRARASVMSLVWRLQDQQNPPTRTPATPFQALRTPLSASYLDIRYRYAYGMSYVRGAAMESVTATAARNDLYGLIRSVNDDCTPVAITSSRAPSWLTRTSGPQSRRPSTSWGFPALPRAFWRASQSPSVTASQPTGWSGSRCGTSSSPGRLPRMPRGSRSLD